MPAGMILDRTASIWRFTNKPGAARTRDQTQAYGSVKCSIVPVSSFDSPQAYRYESTHILWVENWLVLRKGDEVRYGRRLPDEFGSVAPEVFVINGRRRYSESVQLAAYYVREGE